MGCNSNGSGGDGTADERPNVFALVIYIPDPLGKFLDDLRRELVPHYNPHAHVSVLPPRTLDCDWRRGAGMARAVLETCPPFEVELTDVHTFPNTDVIYLGVGEGASVLRELHRTIGRGVLCFSEPFPYCPHVTLAQEVPHERVPEMEDIARRRWREFDGPRTFRASRVVFVQNAQKDSWVDLDVYELKPAVAKL